MGITVTGFRKAALIALSAVTLGVLVCVLLKWPRVSQQPHWPAQAPKPLVLPFTADAMTGLTITIGRPFEFIFTVAPSRLPEFFRAMDGAASIPLPTVRSFDDGFLGWPSTDPLLVVTLKDCSKVEIMMIVDGKPPFWLDAQKTQTLFESPKLVALVNETIHAGLMADLADPDFGKKFKAAAALFERGDPVGHGILVESLKSDKPLNVRAGAAMRLVKEHDPEALKTADDLAGANLSQDDGQRLVMAIEDGVPAQVVPILRKFWVEGKFVLHDRFAIQALGKIGTPEAVDVLIEIWSDRPDLRVALLDTVGQWFEPTERAKAAAWWAKNKGRPRMELLADGYVSDAQGRGYGQYPLQVMKKLDQAGAVKELTRRLPAASGYELGRITRGLRSLGVEGVEGD